MRLLKRVGKIIVGIVGALAVLFGLLYLLTIGDYVVPGTVATDPSLPRIVIDGTTYHAETFGDPANPAVITIHGGPGSDYRSILSLKALSDEYYVVFFDQRGAGLSERTDPEGITLESAIADLNSFVDLYGEGSRVDLVGHSWGAMLASAYIGRFPDKVNHVVLAEPAFLTSEFAAMWADQTKLQFSFPLLYHFIKTKFEALHVRGPDPHASDDYFSHTWSMYQGDDHPQAGYRCTGGTPEEGETWRFGAQAAESIFQEALDENGNFNISFVDGVDAFKNSVLFMTGECQKIIGAELQQKHMELFNKADLVVIENAGHEMFYENPTASVEAVRVYLHQPVE